MRNLWRRLFWSWCAVHDVSYNSDMCPACVRSRFVEHEEDEDHPSVGNSLHVRRVLTKRKRRRVQPAT